MKTTSSTTPGAALAKRRAGIVRSIIRAIEYHAPLRDDTDTWAGIPYTMSKEEALHIIAALEESSRTDSQVVERLKADELKRLRKIIGLFPFGAPSSCIEGVDELSNWINELQEAELEGSQSDDRDVAERLKFKWTPMGFNEVDAALVLLTTIEEGPGSSGVKGFIKIFGNNPPHLSGRYDVTFETADTKSKAKEEGET